MSKHEHSFRMTVHMDGCHFYTSTFACECGATLHTYDERDVESDPYSMIWMEPTSDEACDRCVELIGGAEPKHEQEIVEKAAS